MSSLLNLLNLAIGVIVSGLLLYGAFLVGVIVLAVALGIGAVGFVVLILFSQWKLWQAKRQGHFPAGPRIIEAEYSVTESSRD